ncbi:MAG: hypothetical protein IIA61_10600 [Candidatus Marinimicrobia bacterium]|nr:hypothetical protein [Candidatus Neomarinimicrobiota bacterium]
MWKIKSELVGLTTAYEYYFNRLRPNYYQKYRTPYQRMKHAEIQSMPAGKQAKPLKTPASGR